MFGRMNNRKKKKVEKKGLKLWMMEVNIYRVKMNNDNEWRA